MHILHILAASCDAKIGSAIIEGIAVMMVNKKPFRSVDNLPMQTDFYCIVESDSCASDGVKFAVVTIEAPFEAAETVIILRVQNRP